MATAIKQQRQFTGLSQAEVAHHRQRGETNDYQSRVGRSYWDIFRDNVLNLFNIVLFIFLFITLYFRDYGTFFFAGFSVISNTLLGAIQEAQAKHRLDKLAQQSQQKVTVWRDGQRQAIHVHEVVLNDVIALEPGSKIVVDGTVLQSDALEVDEAALTGESDAVYKEANDKVYSGSFCVAGAGVMQAEVVGKDSQINTISSIARQYKYVRTPTQKRIDVVVELSVVIMLVFLPLLLLANLVIQQPALTFLETVRNAVVLMTTLVPQGLVLTAILSLTLSAIKITRQETLVQKVNAVESLANATVLCFDKTGTLTENKLAVDNIIPIGETDKNQAELLLATYVNSLAHANLTAQAICDYFPDLPEKSKIKEWGFVSRRKWGAIQFDDGIYALGAPEMLTNDAVLLKTPHQYQQQGKRVLLFGKTEQVPNGNTLQVTPIAFVVMSDTARKDIHKILQRFHDENIQLIVISGDHPETVQAIAQEAGLENVNAISGYMLDEMTLTEIQQAVRDYQVFARVSPETKQRIVEVLQANGEYVAMIGDGVNDVPALKQADLAIVMADGTQMSKDIADIVLLQNNLETLPNAFVEGIETTQTIYGTTTLFLTRSAHHVLMFLYVMFAGLAFPLTPVQMAWATFGSVNIVATLIALNMLRPQPIEIFRRDVLDMIIIGGFIGSVVTAVLYIIVFLGTGRDIMVARSALTLFVVLFNALIGLHIVGVDFMRGATVRQHPRTILLIAAFVTGTIALMYVIPNILEFTPVTDIWILSLIGILTVLSSVLLSVSLRNRGILYRLWALVSLEPRDMSNAIPD